MDLAQLGGRIQKVREQLLGLTQIEVAKEMGTVQTLVSRFERGLGGNIHFLIEYMNFIDSKGYPAHLLFSKEFAIELFKTHKKTVTESETITPLEKQVSELKYFLQKGFEKIIMLENMIAVKEVSSDKIDSKKQKSILKRKK